MLVQQCFPKSSPPLRDGWIEDQLVLNHMVTRIALGGNETKIREVKVMQSFRERISLRRLLDTLSTCPHSVERLALVGIEIDEEYTDSLAACISSIRSLQVCRLLPRGLSALCAPINPFEGLRELRLTFHHDVSLELTMKLFAAISASPSVEVLKLSGLDMTDEISLQSCAQLIRSSQGLKSLCLSDCRLVKPICLIDAVHDMNTLHEIDLSRNRISCSNSLVGLLETPSLHSICLSCNRMQDVSSSGRVLQALSRNKTLRRLFLDMNPLKRGLGQELLIALQNYNTTLKRIGILTLDSEDATIHGYIRHLVALNNVGRAVVRQQPFLLHYLLARNNKELDMMFGLLRECPAFWVP